MINLCFLIRQQPFEDSKVLKLEIMNEVTNFVLLYHTMLFTEYVTTIDTRYLIGWSFILVTCANMLVHFSLLVFETGSEMRKNFRQSKCYKNNCITKKKEGECDLEKTNKING